MGKLFREKIFGTNKPEIKLIPYDLLACSPSPIHPFTLRQQTTKLTNVI